MKHRNVLSTALRIALVLPLMLMLSTAVSGAAELNWPKPCYEGEELAKIRAWEKEWVGKRVDAGNVAEVKEYLPEEYYNSVEKWGANYWFNILPYEYIPPTPGDEKLTKKYAGTCTIDADEALQNFIVGIPFPEPKTGLEIAYNFDNLNAGDSLKAYSEAWLIDGKRQYDRHLVLDAHMLWYSGRREVEPVPEFLPNKKQIFRITHGAYIEPASLKGTRSCSIKWKDRSRDWASYSYSSSTRRITRRSTNQRQSSLGGTDVTYNDDWIYSWNIPDNNYKILGRKDLLLIRHQDWETISENHVEGEVLCAAEKRELVKTYVVEVAAKDPNYVYSKEVWYVDPETWWIRYADKWDKRGKMWKNFECAGYVLTSKFNGSKCPQLCFMHVIDVQRNHGTVTSSNAEIGFTDYRFQPEFYGPAALQKYGY